MTEERVLSIDRLIDDLALLSDLNEAARRQVRENAAIREFAPGGTLWRAGEAADSLHVIIVGEVHIVHASDGRQHVVHSEGSGTIIGDVPLFDGGVYPATAQAFTRVSTLRIPKHALFAAMASDPALSRSLLHGLASRVRVLVDGLFRVTLRTVRSRVAEHLLDRAGSGADRKQIVTLGCTQAVLAERLGTVRETVSREIAGLRRQGVLHGAGRGGYQITDYDALERIAAGVR